MTTDPDVSVVMPVFNAEEWVAGALSSALAQSHAHLEVICVDDASTDRTVDIIRKIQAQDPRIRLLHQRRNVSPFQGRRRAIFDARSPFVLFLDADDELEPDAVASALEASRSAEADVVGFGVSVLDPAGETVAGYQNRLQPPQEELSGEAILRAFFSVEKPAQGQLWRYLFSTELLRSSYARLPQNIELYRAEDLPVTFLALAAADRYTYVPERLYRYHFRRGGSGKTVTDMAQFRYYADALRSIDAMTPALEPLCVTRHDGKQLPTLLTSIRMSVLGNILGYMRDVVDPRLLHECMTLLAASVSREELRASAESAPELYAFLAEHGYIDRTG